MEECEDQCEDVQQFQETACPPKSSLKRPVQSIYDENSIFQEYIRKLTLQTDPVEQAKDLRGIANFLDPPLRPPLSGVAYSDVNERTQRRAQSRMVTMADEIKDAIGIESDEDFAIFLSEFISKKLRNTRSCKADDDDDDQTLSVNQKFLEMIEKDQ